MLKKTVIYVAGFFCFVLSARADEDFFDNLIVDETLKQKVEENIEREKAQEKAAEILDQNFLLLRADQEKKRQEEEKKKLEEEKKFEEENAVLKLEDAPFGLKWLATKKEIESLGILLAPYSVKDAPNSYMASNLLKPVKAMREILISFGEGDSLWRISGYGKFLQDDSRASKGIAEYRKFFDMLEEKYGNGEEFYTPFVENVEEASLAPDGTTSKTIKQKIMQIGDDGFLQRLASGESTLYATFENDHIAVTLALLADGNRQTYIIIDYKNLKADEAERDEIYDAL